MLRVITGTRTVTVIARLIIQNINSRRRRRRYLPCQCLYLNILLALPWRRLTRLPQEPPGNATSTYASTKGHATKSRFSKNKILGFLMKIIKCCSLFLSTRQLRIKSVACILNLRLCNFVNANGTIRK